MKKGDEGTWEITDISDNDAFHGTEEFIGLTITGRVLHIRDSGYCGIRGYIGDDKSHTITFAEVGLEEV